MMDDAKIIELFFERSEQAIRELYEIWKTLPQNFIQHPKQQAGCGGMLERRLLRRMERHPPGGA